MTNKDNPFPSPSSHLSGKKLLEYMRHEVTAEEKKLIEKHLDACDFCSDAMKGISELPDALKIYNITREIKKRMGKKVFQKKKIFSLTDLLSILTLYIILGIIIIVAYYFLIFKR